MDDKNLVQCPNCLKAFDIDETFRWEPDENGHPTVECCNCPHCGVGTTPMMSCDWCPLGVAKKCTREEECPCCISFNYEDFKEYKK